jgi:hypothetical protein
MLIETKIGIRRRISLPSKDSKEGAEQEKEEDVKSSAHTAERHYHNIIISQYLTYFGV